MPLPNTSMPPSDDRHAGLDEPLGAGGGALGRELGVADLHLDGRPSTPPSSSLIELDAGLRRRRLSSGKEPAGVFSWLIMPSDDGLAVGLGGLVGHEVGEGALAGAGQQVRAGVGAGTVVGAGAGVGAVGGVGRFRFGLAAPRRDDGGERQRPDPSPRTHRAPSGVALPCDTLDDGEHRSPAAAGLSRGGGRGARRGGRPRCRWRSRGRAAARW